ncbi:MAG: hypothetical protein R3200_04950 [Xanthomonadales bacterium]|nr:hypothetical protein [Xanthomonadales bacterium]
MNIGKTCWLLLLGLFALPALAQDTQTVTVPLSNPGEPLVLDIDLISGEIHIFGEDREDVVFEVTAGPSGRKIITPSGAKSVPGGGLDIEIEERNNRVEVDSDWRSKGVVVTARIPRRARVTAETVHDGVISIRDVEGELELDNVHGSISAAGISGSVIAESVHGDIDVEIVQAASEKPMAFTTMHGDVTIGLPSRHGAELRIMSAGDEVYTDFEVEILPNEPKVDRRSDSGRFVVELDREIVAAINGGGPQIKIETRYGDVRITKSDQ